MFEIIDAQIIESKVYSQVYFKTNQDHKTAVNQNKTNSIALSHVNSVENRFKISK